MLHFALHHPGVAGRPVYIFGVGELDVEVMCKDEIIGFLTIPPKASHEYILEKVNQGCGSPNIDSFSMLIVCFALFCFVLLCFVLFCFVCLFVCLFVLVFVCVVLLCFVLFCFVVVVVAVLVVVVVVVVAAVVVVGGGADVCLNDDDDDDDDDGIFLFATAHHLRRYSDEI